MPSISCRCGYNFSIIQSPHPNEFTLISDLNGETLTQSIIDTVKADDDAWPKVDFLISSAGFPVYICPSCKGHLIFWKGPNAPAEYYKREFD